MAQRKPDSPSTRTTVRVKQPASISRTKTRFRQAPPAVNQEEHRGIRLTRRALILAFVCFVLLISYLTTLRVYFSLQRDISNTKAQIAETQEKIQDLEEELQRWDDPEYVKTQARNKLGWVLPGEVGYRVIDENGQVIGQTQISDEGSLPEGEIPGDAWFSKMWGSTQAADNPS